jgi:hypothetical protein
VPWRRPLPASLQPADLPLMTSFLCALFLCASFIRSLPTIPTPSHQAVGQRHIRLVWWQPRLLIWSPGPAPLTHQRCPRAQGPRGCCQLHVRTPLPPSLLAPRSLLMRTSSPHVYSLLMHFPHFPTSPSAAALSRTWPRASGTALCSLSSLPWVLSSWRGSSSSRW